MAAVAVWRDINGIQDAAYIAITLTFTNNCCSTYDLTSIVDVIKLAAETCPKAYNVYIP